MKAAIVAISDIHAGSTFALLPPHGVELDDGQVVLPNKYQSALWECWLDFWSHHVPTITKGYDKKAVVINGDLIDGVHHRTIALVSNSWEVQEKLATEILSPLPRHVGPTYVVRGTEAHSDVGAQSEERIARAIGAKKLDGHCSVYQLWIEAEGVLIQFAHHVGTTSSAAYESSALMREMVAGLVEAGQFNKKLPSLFVRSHRHRYCEVSVPAAEGKKTCIVTPGWQLRTPYIEKWDRMRLPHIGGLVILIENGHYEVHTKLYPLPEPEPVRL